MFVNGLALFTITAIPSKAIVNEDNPLSDSETFRFLDDIPMSQIPWVTAFIFDSLKGRRFC